MALAAVVVAAGLSSRMGAPKQLLRWGARPMVRQVVDTLYEAEVGAVIVVTGHAHQQVAEALRDCPARCVFNEAYATHDMMLSFQVGLKAVPEAEAVLLALGDQPQLEAAVVRAVVARWRQAQALIVAPSYQRRRGHPLLLAPPLWEALQQVPPGVTLREFLRARAELIDYVEVQTDTILRDVDTVADYRREAPP